MLLALVMGNTIFDHFRFFFNSVVDLSTFVGFVAIELARFLQIILIGLKSLTFLILLCLFAMKTRLNFCSRWRTTLKVM